ncbi:hypothetical protein GQ457_05G026000 [Hibiscus cannabinus]
MARHRNHFPTSRSLKKVRNNVVEGSKLDKSPMEADGGVDSTLHDDKNDQPVVDATNKGEDVCGAGKVSYADMVVSSTKSFKGDALATKFVEEEVVILDEDVQMDTLEPIPSISFFDKVHDQIDRNMGNTIIVHLLGCFIGYKALLSFAQLAVIVDLNKPLLFFIRIDGRIQKLEYEGLHHICFECGVFGHSKEVCLSLQKYDEASDVHNSKGKEVAKKVEDNNQGVELYGSWMMVGTHRRRFAAKSGKVKWMVNVGTDGIHQ